MYNVSIFPRRHASRGVFPPIIGRQDSRRRTRHYDEVSTKDHPAWICQSTLQTTIFHPSHSDRQQSSESNHQHSEPRALAGHVSKRTDRKVNALPPPPKRKINIQSNDKDSEEPEEKRDGHGDGDREDNTLLQGSGAEESDEEFESAEEDLSEEIWDEETRRQIQAEAQAELEKQNARAEARIFRPSQFLDGPGWITLESGSGYQLLAEDHKRVWRVTGPASGSYTRMIRINLVQLRNAGWIWDDVNRGWNRDFWKAQIFCTEVMEWKSFHRAYVGPPFCAQVFRSLCV
ncbi:uncharacterized protein LY89DRAFT_23335 [Mollisia scopiformis]|uniref:Uncharacterized protein n=1 Tax=Mollisia scopiformis TaxID=149040 RepID=A0A194XWS4_MOLSC|nr:uncharacterized protein LY89DRAFT_23335 [Mollisia scopiformis]KUJ24479.1 hypothetical protein LY89DRAFT_23335 [Mollisia scopiformis]